MPRIFLSHSSKDTDQAEAVMKWLTHKDTSLTGDIFLDVDRQSGLKLGEKWRNSIWREIDRSEIMVCLLSAHWEASAECKNEYLVAEVKGKTIIPARLDSTVTETIAGGWQWAELGADGAKTLEEIGPLSFSLEGLEDLLKAVQSPDGDAKPFDWTTDRLPFRGLDALVEADAAVLFGRDTELARALVALRSTRLTDTSVVVLPGASGAGKSSFLHAGIIPRLKREKKNFVVFDVMRPGTRAITGHGGLIDSISAVYGTTTEVAKACEDSAAFVQLLSRIQNANVEKNENGEDGPAPTLHSADRPGRGPFRSSGRFGRGESGETGPGDDR